MQVLFCNPRISFTGIYQRERMCSQPVNFVDEVARTLVIGLGARGYMSNITHAPGTEEVSTVVKDNVPKLPIHNSRSLFSHIRCHNNYDILIYKPASI